MSISSFFNGRIVSIVKPVSEPKNICHFFEKFLHWRVYVDSVKHIVVMIILCSCGSPLSAFMSAACMECFTLCRLTDRFFFSDHL